MSKNPFKEFQINGVRFKYFESVHPKCRKYPEFMNEWFEFETSFINSGDIVIDIGTHSGQETLMYAIAVGENGMVYGFEPNPYIYPDLMRNCQGNPHLKITPIMKAATELDGKYVFHYSDPGFCNGGFSEKTDAGVGACGHIYPLEVEGINVEDFMINILGDNISKISFIKVDAEGYDFYILMSMVKLIRLIQPAIKSELFRFLSEREVERHLEFFDNINYESYIFDMSVNHNKKIDREYLSNLWRVTKLDAKNIFDKKENTISGFDIISIPMGAKI